MNKNNDFLVSILIPFYNSSEFMHQCLKSALNQTYQNFEIVCLDDCSTDNTYKILLDYQKRNSKIRVFKNDENKQISSSRNKLISLARGKYFIFLDSDDYLTENALELLVKNSNNGTVDIVTGKTWLVFLENKLKVKLPFFIISSNFKKDDNYSFVKKNLCLCWMHLFRKDFWNELNIKFLKDTKFEDFGLIPYVFLKAKTFRFVNQRLYHYQRRSGSLSDFTIANASDQIFDLLKQFSNNLSLFFNNNMLSSKKARRSLNGILLVNIYAVFLLRKKLIKAHYKNIQEIDKEIYKTMNEYKIVLNYSKTWWKSIIYFYNSLTLWFKFSKITKNKKNDLKKIKIKYYL